jgi:hypothetical protein
MNLDIIIRFRGKINMKIKATVLRQFNKPASIEKIEWAPPKGKEVQS